MEEVYTILKFNTPTGLVQFNIKNDICIDPNTNQPFKYAVVHGNTWRTTLHAELRASHYDSNTDNDAADLNEAFTPCAVPMLNHRGIYEYNTESQTYNKYRFTDEESNASNSTDLDWKNVTN